MRLDVESLQWSFVPGEAAFLSVPGMVVRAGEVVAVTGPSGSGKTSLLFLLAGIERPASGRIRWDGTDIAALGESARDRWRRARAGLVFQDFRLIEDLSVTENILLPSSFARWSPGPELRSRARSLIERMGLPDPHQPAATLSRGEMQRTALARALLFRPRLILADEPTASLDAANEAAVSDLLLEAAREDGVTLLVATHQAALRDRADRVISLEHGRVVSDIPREQRA